MHDAAVVKVDDSFVSVGGYERDIGHLETIFGYDSQTETWTELAGTISIGKRSLSAFRVEAEWFPNCSSANS